MVCRRCGGPLESSRCSVISKALRLARSTRVGHPVPDVAAPTAKVFRIGADPGASIATSQRSQAELQHSAWAPVSAPGSALGVLLSRARSSAQAVPHWGCRACTQPLAPRDRPSLDRLAPPATGVMDPSSSHMPRSPSTPFRSLSSLLMNSQRVLKGMTRSYGVCSWIP
jgi:hypothetical protein